MMAVVCRMCQAWCVNLKFDEDDGSLGASAEPVD